MVVPAWSVSTRGTRSARVRRHPQDVVCEEPFRSFPVRRVPGPQNACQLASLPADQRRTGCRFDKWIDGLHRALRGAAESVILEDRVRLHDHVRAIHSFMVFALNLFLPFRRGDPGPLGRLLTTRLSRPVVVERVVFEYVGPGDVLAEVAGVASGSRRPPRSQRLAVVRDAPYRPEIALIEAKGRRRMASMLAPARTAMADDRRDVCGSPPDPSRTPQVAN